MMAGIICDACDQTDTIIRPMTIETTIRVGVRTRSLSEQRLQYIRQLGATDVFIDHADVEEQPDEFNDRDRAQPSRSAETRFRR